MINTNVETNLDNKEDFTKSSIYQSALKAHSQDPMDDDSLLRINDAEVVEEPQPGQVGAPITEAEKLRKRSIKSDLFSAIGTFALNSIPIISKYIKHRKEANPTPFQVDRGDALRLAVTMALPTVKVLDTLFLGSKIQKTIEQKTSFKYNDVQNVVNLVGVYPSFHKFSTCFAENVSRKSVGKGEIPMPEHLKRNIFLSGATLIAPYIASKMANEELTFAEKITSILPLHVTGKLVRSVVSVNPDLQNAYNVGTSMLQVASFGANKLSTAVRPTPGSSVNKTVNEVGNVVNFLSEMVGAKNSYGSYYGNGYNDYYNNGWGGGPQRWSF